MEYGIAVASNVVRGSPSSAPRNSASRMRGFTTLEDLSLDLPVQQKQHLESARYFAADCLDWARAIFPPFGIRRFFGGSSADTFGESCSPRCVS
jgi:hypothetical protein